MARETYDLAICYDCLSELANGETPDGADPTRKDREGWEGMEITLGTLHHEGCANDPEWIGAECDCEDLGFTRYGCELCTSDYAGDKFAATAWATDDDPTNPIPQV